MTLSAVTSQNAMQSCLDKIQHKVCSVKNKICELQNTSSKIYIFLIVGRFLQAASLASFVASIVFTFVVGPVSLIAAIPAIALGILGSYVAESPEKLSDVLMMNPPFMLGQPIGLINSGGNCWLNSSLQILANSPSFHRRLRQIPAFAQFLDSYAAAQSSCQRVANINIEALRQFLSRETGGQITSGHTQADATELFEYLFQGPHAIYQLEQRLDGRISHRLRLEPMIEISLGAAPYPNLQQLFNEYFDYQSFDHLLNVNQHIQLFFPHPPDELLIQAKRFYQQMDPINGSLQQGKINDPIDVPERLIIQSRFVRTGESPHYICDAFSIHNGVSLNAGHYISYIKIKNTNTWWYCSDNVVYEVPAAQALNAMRNGYIFHYSREA